MVKNKRIMIGMVFMIFLIGGIMAVGEVSFCCERMKTVSGGAGLWCQNAPLEECYGVGGGEFQAIPTSCESTSYCKLGCCHNLNEGTCMKNTPQANCNDESGGVWSDDSTCDIPQCQLGCCVLGGQAAFVTKTRCNSLSAIYGLEINYREDIQNEAECISTATSKKEGACVFEREYKLTCKKTTQKECNELKTNDEYSNVNFHESFLCSSDKLGADCGMSEKTTCVDGKDEVYFVDTCGNVANVYDYDQRNNPLYWEEIQPSSCEFDGGNGKICGNCDYLDGSTCKESKIGDLRPALGDYYCQDLGCEVPDDIFELMHTPAGKVTTNKKIKHGESFCVVAGTQGELLDGVVEIYRDEENAITTIDGSSAGSGAKITEGITEVDVMGYDKLELLRDKYNLPGSRHFRMICYDGEIIVEPCADYREEVCIQSSMDEKGDEFLTAKCRINQWQECATQTTVKNCNDRTKRDCIWFDGGGLGVCVPIYSPGLKFWEESGESVCMGATLSCEREYLKDINTAFQGHLEKGSTCGDEKWKQANKIYSMLLGDCGVKRNYLGYFGQDQGATLEVESGDWEHGTKVGNFGFG